MQPETATIPSAPDPVDFDVVVVGGALAGASTALLLKRRQPSLRILVVELRERFGHKVGEATVEVSGFFLEQVLQLGDHLYREHLPKHGLRYWFAASSEDTLETMGEVGPIAAPHVPSFQLDRSKLDQHVLDLAVAEGAELARPARVKEYNESWPRSEVVIESLENSSSNGAEVGGNAGGSGDDGGSTSQTRTVRCRWLVDASGRHAFLGRKKNLLQRLEEHPTAASWSRWEGVLDLDGHEFLGAESAPRLPRLRAQRRLATNHFTGYGWWCWVIPLANGKTSVGLVYDKRLIDPQDGVGPLGRDEEQPSSDGQRLDARQRYQRFVRAQPGLRQLLKDATMCDDCMTYSYVPYSCTQYMDKGWALVGDAGSFIDPYYSPGLDHLAMSVTATTKLIGEDLENADTTKCTDDAGLIEAIAAHNRAFSVSYQRWFEALYQDKYEILGDGELVTASFLLETSFYYFGVVTPILRNAEALRNPTFGAPLPQSRVAYRMARALRRRMVRLAALRRERGIYGHRNDQLQLYPKGFGIGWRVWPTVLRGLLIWGRCEWDQLFARSKTPQTEA